MTRFTSLPSIPHLPEGVAFVPVCAEGDTLPVSTPVDYLFRYRHRIGLVVLIDPEHAFHAREVDHVTAERSRLFA